MGDFHLQCGLCGRRAASAPGAGTCLECGKPLLVRYDLRPVEGGGPPPAWCRRGGGMWRYRGVLPLRPGEEPVSLGEGGTPLLPLSRLGEELGLRLLVKDEGRNPTGSFKDRGLSAAVTRGVRDGFTRFVMPSAGNAGAALAAYAARAQVSARIYIPSDAPPGVERRCREHGAEVVLVDGLITECARRAAEYAAATKAVDLSTLREPYRIEGKKTMMLEIVQDLGWRPPDAIVYPTGGGTGLIGSAKALSEMTALGIASATTRLYAVQSSGCAPIVEAWSQGWEEARSWERVDTVAWGLRVPCALGDSLILRALRGSAGGAVAVADEEMRRGAAELASREGVSASIEGGATLAAARSLRAAGELREGETVVLFNTAHMLVY